MAWWIFQNLVTTAALAATVAIVCRFARIGPVARHALWVLVLVKFITPPLVVWPWSAPDPLGLAQVDARAAAGPLVLATLEPMAERSGNLAAPPLPVDADGGNSMTASRSPVPGDRRTDVWSWLLGIWIAGSVCLLGIEVARLTRLASQVRSGRVADPVIAKRVKELALQLGVNPVPVVMLRGIASPVVWCLGRPRLLWPAQLSDSGLTNASVNGLIVHELAHIKRRDHIVGWIELIAGLVWWWNPLFWSVRSALREQAELACDAWVISALPNGRRAYAESLLALSTLGAASSPSMAAVVGVRASSRRVLERRLVMIMKGRAPLRLPSAGLLTLAVMAVATLPAWATGTNEDRQQPAQAAQQAQPVQPTQQPAQTAQPTQAPAQPQPQQSRVTPATAATPSPQAPPAARVIRPTEARTPAPATAQRTRVTGSAPATAAQVQPSQRRSVAVAPARDERVRAQEGRQVVVAPSLQGRKFAFFAAPSSLTEEGQKLVTGFETDREAIQKEADAKIQARREATIKQLQALQDQYAKSGKLDEAVAIRDYLRAGGPNDKFSWVIKRNP